MRSLLLKALIPLGTLVLVPNAGAAVVFFEPAGGIPIPTDFAGVSVDLETGATSNALDGLPNGDANFFFGGAELSNDADATASSPSWQPVRTVAGSTDPAANLTAGVDLVDGTSVFASGFGSSGDLSTHFPPFTAGQPGYIGFSLIPDGGGGPYYGWMLVTLEDDGVTPGLIHSWAYDDMGAGLLVGAIPEPSAAVLGLLGLCAALMRRRR